MNRRHFEHQVISQDDELQLRNATWMHVHPSCNCETHLFARRLGFLFVMNHGFVFGLCPWRTVYYTHKISWKLYFAASLLVCDRWTSLPTNTTTTITTTFTTTTSTTATTTISTTTTTTATTTNITTTTTVVLHHHQTSTTTPLLTTTTTTMVNYYHHHHHNHRQHH